MRINIQEYASPHDKSLKHVAYRSIWASSV